MSKVPGFIEGGPDFTLASRQAFLGLGNSERLATGEFLKQTLLDRGIFDRVDLLTINQVAQLKRRASKSNTAEKEFDELQEAALGRVLIMRSAFPLRPFPALQAINMNGAEGSIPRRQQIIRGLKIGGDDNRPEEGAHKVDFVDMMGAGRELARSPSTLVETMGMIQGEASSTEMLIENADWYPEVTASIHSEFDGFGFPALADTERAVANGVVSLLLPDHYHNEILFAPNRTIDAMTPRIFPARKLY